MFNYFFIFLRYFYRVRERNDKNQQSNLSSFFKSKYDDIEDIGTQRSSFKSPLKKRFAVVKKKDHLLLVDTNLTSVNDQQQDQPQQNIMEEKELNPDVMEIEMEETKEETKEEMKEESKSMEDVIETSIVPSSSKMPEMTSDFAGWLKYNKKSWRTLRTKRRMDKHMSNMSYDHTQLNVPRASMKSGLKGFLKQSAAAVRTK
jgi:hypothetical protein